MLAALLLFLLSSCISSNGISHDDQKIHITQLEGKKPTNLCSMDGAMDWLIRVNCVWAYLKLPGGHSLVKYVKPCEVWESMVPNLYVETQFLEGCETHHLIADKENVVSPIETKME